jgi:hypothetical protein
MAPFTHLTQKDQKKSWVIEVDSAFQSLKAYFVTYPLLIHASPSKPFVLETKRFQLCNRHHTFTTWKRQCSSSCQLLFS